MKYRFHPLADDELNEAADYYEDKKEGLGLEFVEEVYSTIQRMVDFPLAWSKLSEHSRRCITNRFPYQVAKSESSIFSLLLLGTFIENQITGKTD